MLGHINIQLTYNISTECSEMTQKILTFPSIRDALEFFTQANNLNEYPLMALYIFWIYFDVSS